MNPNWRTKNKLTSKRGAFLDGIWYCDCEPRLPADKFQTKNGGQNHGRWFYTCQRPQFKRCSFFLWSDEAKVRAEGAVLNNSRTEPGVVQAEPQTPKKERLAAHPPTPSTKATSYSASPTIKTKGGTWLPEENFDWPSSGDEDLISVADATPSKMTAHFETPHQAARTEERNSSPSKRKLTDLLETGDDVFSTPFTSNRSRGLFSPIETPVQKALPGHSAPSQLDTSTLAKDTLNILQPVKLPKDVEKELVELLNRHDLRTQGITRGRDIARIAIQTREKTIAELQARLAALEADQETNRGVIAHLKSDMVASSPKKRGGFPGRKSEV